MQGKCLFPSAVHRDVLEGEDGAVQMLWLAQLPAWRQQIPIHQALPPAPLDISQVQVYLHHPVVLTGFKAASCFLAIIIPFFLS